ncbi:hypothetical protein WR25_24907 [Diploscapter pachys]|uniref:EGF-like domain-containing protein n=1 Tax=Diploscapter pachys TaxID=2018661 RepID=A0A2A2LC47_9BILA|nr:hypothetical protein WR25_24907 [Diploscapter pachys]
MLVRGKYGISLINFIGFLAVYILIYSIVPVEGLLPLPPITLVPPSAVEPNPDRPPHGCYNYGLCTNPKKKTITSPKVAVVWDCAHTDCVCVTGIGNGTYTCSDRPTLCLSDPCGISKGMDHMECVDGFGTYNCTCKAGWTGSDCNMDMDDPCAEAPCLNVYNYCKNNTCAGTCTQELGDSTWKCNCPSGYQGPDCTKTYAIWVSTNEENLGCYNYIGDVLDSNCKKISSPMNTMDYCKQQQMTTMDPFYNRFAISGQNCYLCNDTFTLPKIGGDPKNDQKCTEKCSGDKSKICGEGDRRVWMYKNTNYIWDPDQCANTNGTSPCSQGTGQGICIDDEGAYSCRCHPKYTGNDCETPVDDPCLAEPCENNGTCIADPNTLNYKCKCLEGYHGTNCEHKKQCENTTCDNMGTCYEKDDGTPGCICLT